MGNIVNFLGCKYMKYENEETITKNNINKEQVPQSLIDIIIDSNNFYQRKY